MVRKSRSSQAGYALLLTVLALMGIGGVVLAGFTQDAKTELEVQRYQHNQRVLKQAKQALLMFAYNYPQTNPGIGPGRLPCPDNDNNGAIEFPPDCNPVGRFPWKDVRLATAQLQDSSGETLWYAVSDAFANFPAGPAANFDVYPDLAAGINSSTAGTITLVDQSGDIIYDGEVAGIAAVIIAPGPILKRDENNDGIYEYTQRRDTDARKRDPRNYLDTFDGFDNAVFTNSESDSNDDGFIMGPVYDVTQTTLVVNDQLVIVTAEEVIAMAEMATLEAYRSAIIGYRDDPANVNNVYPWLYNYDGVEFDAGAGETNDDAVGKLSAYYPADPAAFGVAPDYHDDNGRIPSIFAEYFSENDSLKIETRLSGEFEFNFATLGSAVGGIGNLNFSSATLTKSFADVSVSTAVGFEDVDGNDADQQGRFTAVLGNPIQETVTYYFKGDHNNASGVFNLCPGGADSASDCDDSSNVSVLQVDLTITIPAGTISIDTDHAVNPPTNIAVTSWPTSNSHARIEAKYDLANTLVSGNMPGVIEVSAYFYYDAHYHVGNYFGEHNGLSDGVLTIDDLFLNSSITINMDYYPELPAWAYSNGWHNSILMAYAEDHRPGVPGDCTAGVDCLEINESDPGGSNDTVALLLIGRGHAWQDNNEVLPNNDSFADGRLKDELRDVFDEGNHNGNTTYYTRRGNDRVLVIQ